MRLPQRSWSLYNYSYYTLRLGLYECVIVLVSLIQWLALRESGHPSVTDALI